ILVRHQFPIANFAEKQIFVAVGKNGLSSFPDFFQLPASSFAPANFYGVRKIQRLKLLQRIAEVFCVVEEINRLTELLEQPRQDSVVAASLQSQELNLQDIPVIGVFGARRLGILVHRAVSISSARSRSLGRSR